MINSSEVHSESSWNTWSEASSSVEMTHECDWCGQAVNRETACTRAVGKGDEVEVVLLCPECDHGAD
jgi:hypothetical protein